MFDPAKVEKIGPNYWRHSFLSVCRFAGAGVINGVKYVLDPETDYLVRDDIWKRELKDKRKSESVAKAEKKRWDAVAQAGLFNQKPSTSQGAMF